MSGLQTHSEYYTIGYQLTCPKVTETDKVFPYKQAKIHQKSPIIEFLFEISYIEIMNDILDQPLSKKSLINRYKPAFDALNKGLCVSIIGLPLTGRSVFFRSMIESKGKDFDDLVKPTKNAYIFIDNYTGDKTPDKYKMYIAAKFLTLPNLPKDTLKQLQTAVETMNTDLAFQVIQNYAGGLDKDQRIILVTFGIEDYAREAQQLLPVISELYRSDWGPHPKVVFCFPNDPGILIHKNLVPLHPLLHQSIIYLSELNQEELDYTRERLKTLEYCEIDDTSHKKISELSGGHYGIYKSIAKAFSDGHIELTPDSIKGNPQIKAMLEKVYQTAVEFTGSEDEILKNDILEKIGLTKNGQYHIPLLPVEYTPSPITTQTSSEIDARSDLSPQELLIFDYLEININQIKTREDLAKVLWGDNWLDEYSEQAIDKTISRIRPKIQDSGYQITSIRNRGVRLVKV